MIKKMCVAGMFVLSSSCAFGMDKEDLSGFFNTLRKQYREGCEEVVKSSLTYIEEGPLKSKLHDSNLSEDDKTLKESLLDVCVKMINCVCFDVSRPDTTNGCLLRYCLNLEKEIDSLLPNLGTDDCACERDKVVACLAPLNEHISEFQESIVFSKKKPKN